MCKRAGLQLRWQSAGKACEAPGTQESDYPSTAHTGHEVHTCDPSTGRHAQDQEFKVKPGYKTSCRGGGGRGGGGEERKEASATLLTKISKKI